MRVDAVHEPTEQDCAQRAAHLEHRGDERGRLQRNASALNQRWQPARQQIDHQQAHEESDPEHERAADYLGLEQVTNRGAVGLFVRQDVACAGEILARSDALQRRRDAVQAFAFHDQVAHRFREPPHHQRQQH